MDWAQISPTIGPSHPRTRILLVHFLYIFLFFMRGHVENTRFFFIFFVGVLSLIRNKWGLSQFIAKELKLCVEFLFCQ